MLQLQPALRLKAGSQAVLPSWPRGGAVALTALAQPVWFANSDRMGVMYRCAECRCVLSDAHLLHQENKKMEAARRAYGLDGLHFHYFNCPRCGHDNVFLALTPIPGETREDLKARRALLESTVRSLGSHRTSVMVVAPKPGNQECEQASRNQPNYGELQ